MPAAYGGPGPGQHRKPLPAFHLPYVSLVATRAARPSALAVTQAPWVLFIPLKRCSREAGLCLRGLLFHVKSPGSSWNIDSCHCRNLEDDTGFFSTPNLEAALTRKPPWQTPVTALPVGPQLGTRLQTEQGFRCLFASNRDKHQLACNPERHLLEGCGAEHRQMAS